MADPARIVKFPDLKPVIRRQILGSETGTQFDSQQHLFSLYQNGDVFNYGNYTARDFEVMLSRDGQASAIEAVLTLPIRQASRAIEPAKHDSGECEFVRSVLMAPPTAGGMQTPLQDVIGQVTSAQTVRMSFHEKCFAIRDRDGKIVYDKLAFRPTATCEQKRNAQTAAPDGFRQAVWQFGGVSKSQAHSTTPGYVEIPEVRSFVYVNGKHRQPLTGLSEMELTYWALAHGSEVQTPDGPVLIEDIQVGDDVFGLNGQPTQVTAVHPRGVRQIFRVTLRDGTYADCDADHLWGVHDASRNGQYRVLSTQEILVEGLRRNTANPLWRFKVPGCAPVEYPERDLLVDPYILGCWLGDGSIQKDAHGVRRYGPKLASFEPDEWIVNEVRYRLPADMKLVQAPGARDVRNGRTGAGGDYRFCPVVSHDTNPFRDALVSLGVNRERFIPELYFQGSVKQRFDLLRGLMDTDGSVTRGTGMQVRFYTTSPRLAQDVRHLVRSLGGTATAGSTPSRTTMWVDIFTSHCPFLLPRKAAAWEAGGGGERRSTGNTIVSIEASGSSKCRCITVAAEDGLFLVNDFMTTHNCYQLTNEAQVAFPFTLWLQFLETQSLPKVVVYGQDQTEATSKAEDIASMRASGVVGFRRPPPGEKTFEVLESSGKGAAEFNAALTFLETWQTSSVLAGFTGLSSLASLGRGSLALSQDQSAFFLKSRQAVTAEMESAITHDVIAPLVTLNFGPSAAYPSFKFGPLSDESDTQLVTMFSALAVAPTLQVPTGLLDLISLRLANFLNLDVTAVEAVIQQGAKDRAAQAQQMAPPGMPAKAAAGIGQLAGGVSAATKIAQKALRQAAQQPLPEDMAQPFSEPPTIGSPKA